MDVKELYEKLDSLMGSTVVLEGWIKNHRKQKEFGFIDFSDGTCFSHVQLVYDNKLDTFEEIAKYRVGSAIRVEGVVIESVGSGQKFEVQVKDIKLMGDCPEDYPMQPKRHSNEFLREQAYLRPRVNLFQAVFRVRSVAAMAIHTYFQSRGYVYVHTPLITANDGEGAGEMFQLTTLDLNRIAKSGSVDYEKDFFGKKVGLTVTGQLEAETFALAFKKVYTFGPTFRAENSNTKTHASEFWMIEPEIAFCDLEGLMNIEEDMLKYIVKYVLDNCKVEMEFFDKFISPGLIERLTHVANSDFGRISYTDAIKELEKNNDKFEYPVTWGTDIQTEHERYLSEVVFGKPVFVTDYPKDIKAFYMKQNDDGKTVAATDLLVPGIGELIGGSQREDDLAKLEARMDELGLNKKDYWWYLDLRRYGSITHSGFGLGFERLMMYITGMQNIRDVIPFPRTPKNCEF